MIYQNILMAFNDNLIFFIIAVLLVAYPIVAKRLKFLPALPTIFLLLYLILKLVLKFLPDGLDARLYKTIDVTSWVVLYFAIVRALVSFFVEMPYRLRKKTKLPKINRDLILVISYSIIFLVVLRTRGGVDLVGLITTSAVLTAVIGLAAQNMLGNLFAGLSIQMEHPFRIGDWIEYGSHTGKVMNIGWGTTQLRTFDDETIIIPNLDITKGVIKNHSLPTPRHAMRLDVGIDYNVSPTKVRSVLLDVCRQETCVLKDPTPVVRISNFGDSAINYQIRFFYYDYGTSPDVKMLLMNRIWYALKRAGIKIPFPIRDIKFDHIERKREALKAEKARESSRREIENVPMFAPLDAEAKDRIALRMAIEEYEDGETIVCQGDEGDSLYIIHTGQCDVYVSHGEGHSQKKVATMSPPAFFGEMSLLTGAPRSATVKALGDTIVFSIGKDLFKEFLVAHPEVSEKIAEIISERQHETAGVLDEESGPSDKRATRILSKIRSFFGIG